MTKEVIDRALANKQSVIVNIWNISLSSICSLYPTLMVISPILSTHSDYVINKLPQNDAPVIVVLSESLNRDIINKVCEYAMNQSVIFLVDGDSPDLDAAFSDKCVKL